jgi:ferritin-like metal-binding protein YciE
MVKKSQTHDQFYNMFLENLRDIYSGEQQIIEAMPKVLDAVSTKDLKDKLKAHFEETKKQLQRLKKMFTLLKETPEGTFCEGVSGLINECDKVIESGYPSVVQDAALIAALQKIEHYEIATYGALRTFAKHLELKKVQDILQEILDEEWKADKKLTTVAEGGYFFSGINAAAAED